MSFHKSPDECLDKLNTYVQTIMMAPTLENYDREVDIPTSRMLRQSYDLFWLHDLWQSWTDPDFPYYFDLDAATEKVNFIETLKLTQGSFAGERFLLMDHHHAAAMLFFGWRDKTTDYRRFRTLDLFTGKKSAKSEFAAALGLVVVEDPTDGRGQVYVGSHREETAKIVFASAAAFVDMNSAFAKAFGLRIKDKETIQHVPSKSNLLFLSGDNKAGSGKADGIGTSAVIIDEPHEIPANAGLITALESSSGSRAEPMFVYISTAGTNLNSVAYEHYERAKDILNGVHEPRIHNVLPIIYGVDPEDLEDEDGLFTEEYYWRKANPGYGVCLFPADLQQAAQQAQTLPSLRSNFLNKRLNIWSSNVSSFLHRGDLENCSKHYSLSDLTERPCYIGLDAALTGDLFGIGYFFPATDDQPAYMTGEAVASKESADTHARIANFVESGDILQFGSSRVMDFDMIFQHLLKRIEMLNVQAVYVDPARLTEFKQKLAKETGLVVNDYYQTPRNMDIPLSFVEGSVVERKIEIDLTGSLQWQWENLTIEENKDGMKKPSKLIKSNKIDTVSAMLTACGGWSSYQDYLSKQKDKPKPTDIFDTVFIAAE